MPWINPDGLVVRFDAERIVPSAGGSIHPAGEHVVFDFKINVANLTTTTTNIVLGGESIIFPRNSFIETVEVINEATAATITSLSVGLIRLDRTTELDYDGFVAALALASIDTLGEKVTLNKGSTSAGALIGTELAYPGIPVAYIAGSVGTGIVRVRVKLYVKDADTLVTNY